MRRRSAQGKVYRDRLSERGQARLERSEAPTEDTEQAHRGDGVASPRLLRYIPRVRFTRAGEVGEEAALR
jgi:hypothetical protein